MGSTRETNGYISIIYWICNQLFSNPNLNNSEASQVLHYLQNLLERVHHCHNCLVATKMGRVILAPELTCSCPNKKFEKNSKTFQNILEKIGDEHIQIVYIHDKFRSEIINFLLCAKKSKSVL